MPSTDTATWPEGVIARYLTVGGATVDINHDTLYPDDTEPNVSCARCQGCDAYCNEEWGHYRAFYASSSADDVVRPWAQAHAETCRAMPKPTV